MLNKSIKFLIENKLVAALILIAFVGFGTVYAPFNWNTGFLPSDPVAVDAIPDIGENQQNQELACHQCDARFGMGPAKSFQNGIPRSESDTPSQNTAAHEM